MRDLSLSILDIAQNSIAAGARNISISLLEDEGGQLKITVSDDGRGMSGEVVKKAADPFYTTRTTRKVGLGLPLFRMAAELTGGELVINSITSDDDSVNHGTTVTAVFNTGSVDCPPLGDMLETIAVLIHGYPEKDYKYYHKTPTLEVKLDTSELRGVLGEVSLAEPEVMKWISEYIAQQYNSRIKTSGDNNEK